MSVTFKGSFESITPMMVIRVNFGIPSVYSLTEAVFSIAGYQKNRQQEFMISEHKHV